MEKRAHVRYPLKLDVRVSGPRGLVFPAEIRDFCLGGLFIRCDMSSLATPHGGKAGLSQSELVQIAFSLGGRDYRLGARIASTLQAGMGVEFIQPDPAALLALQEQASRTSTASASRLAESSKVEAGSPGAAVLVEARQALAGFLEAGVQTLFETAGDLLFTSARDAASNAEQAEYLDAGQELGSIRDPVETAFTGVLLEGLDNLGGSRSREQKLAEEEVEELALVDTQVFADMLATQRILERAQSNYSELVFQLNTRLAHIAGTEVDDHNSPLGPVAVCTSFHDAMQNLGISAKARKALFQAFEETLIKDLGEFYKRVNGIFVAHGILPRVERAKPKVPHAPKPRPAPPPAKPLERVDETPPEPVDSFLEPPAGAPPVGPVPAYPQRPYWPQPDAQPMAGAAPEPAPGPDMTPAQPMPAGATSGTGQAMPGWAPQSPYSVGPPMPGEPPTPDQAGQPGVQPLRGAFQTTRTLLNLAQQRLPPGAWRPTGPPTAGRQPTGITSDIAHEPNTYSPREVVDAVSTLQEELGATGLVQLPRETLKSRVLDHLSGRPGQDGRKILGRQQEDAIEVITNVVESILEDILVPDAMKGRLRQLEAPLLKVALQDQGFLEDPSHPARQVVDRLSQLDLPASPVAGSEEAAVIEQLDQTIARVVKDYDHDIGVFQEAIKEIEPLVERQKAAFASNLERVVKACDSEQSVLNNIRRGRQAGPGRAPARNMPKEWKDWIDRVQRLQVGDVLGMQKDGVTRRETLAWVSDDQDKYVFVDSQGRRSSSMIAQEVAMQLQRGSARLLGESELTAMERGLYQVLSEVQQRLAREATHDPRTGLLNGKQFMARLENTLHETRISHAQHVLALLDMDRFSDIGETCGEKAAEVLLERFARVLGKHMAGRGYLGALGGDRFAVLLERCTLDEGYRIADKHRESIEQSRVMWKGEALPVSVSIGLVPVDDSADDVEGLLQQGQALLDEAKRAGGNRALRPEAPSRVPEAHTADATEVARVLAEDRLHLYRQAITPIDPEAGLKTHYEVLVRVVDEDGTVNVPAEFIGMAERSGRMDEVDRWIIRHMLEWMAANKKELLKVGGYAINLSGISLNDEGLTDYVVGLFNETRVPPGKVMFEVTETMAIDRLSVAESFIRLLKGFGCRFSLDDFGTGSSSYAYLRQLPVDYVKIDGLFVRDMLNNENDTAVVQSINEIGHFMGKRTIAEYVENEAILDKLREIGVDYAQGYVLHAPEPLAG